MDRALINEFRKKVDDQDIILQMYRNSYGVSSALQWTGSK